MRLVAYCDVGACFYDYKMVTCGSILQETQRLKGATRTFASVKRPCKKRRSTPTWHHADVVERRDEVAFRGGEVAGEEERQPEEQGVVGELEEAEGDGIRSHGGDGERLKGPVEGGRGGGEREGRSDN